MENGFLDTGGNRKEVLDFPESLIRFGVADSTELRLTAPDYYRNALTDAGQHSGFGDVAIGVKQHLGVAPGGFDFSAIVTLSLPLGSDALSSHGYDPSFQFPWSRKLSSNWTVAGMLSVYVPTQNRSHTVIGETTFLVDRQLTKKWDAFAEYAGDFPQAGSPRHLLHFGTAYKTTSRQQIDFRVGEGVSAVAPGCFLGFGYSFLLIEK